MRLRLRPSPFGRRRKDAASTPSKAMSTGLNTLVATTASSRRAPGNISASRRPVMASHSPPEYVSAVSKKLMPRSTACRNSGREAASSSIHGCHAVDPKVSVPRQMRDTSRPVAPSRTYCMRSRLLRLHAGGLEHAAVLRGVLADRFRHLFRRTTQRIQGELGELLAHVAA